MKNMLKDASEKKCDLKNLNNNQQNVKKDISDNSTGYGLQNGSINCKNFEYKNQHSFMTSEEAIAKCETDFACGGFTFYGIDVPNRKHFVKPIGADRLLRRALQYIL